MSHGQVGTAAHRASDIRALEQRIAELTEEVQRRSSHCTLLQAESKLLRNVHGRLDTSQHNSMDRAAELASQLRRLRADDSVRAATRPSRISALLAGEAHEAWCEIGQSQQLAGLAREAQTAEQRMARTQLWARDQLRRDGNRAGRQSRGRFPELQVELRACRAGPSPPCARAWMTHAAVWPRHAVSLKCCAAIRNCSFGDHVSVCTDETAERENG